MEVSRIFLLLLLAGCAEKASKVSAKNLELSRLPIASYSLPALDQDVVLTQAPLPMPCGGDQESVSFCTAPEALKMARSRYLRLRADWGERRSPPARLRKLIQNNADQWTLSLHSDQERPLVWVDPNHPRSLVLWPVEASISQTQATYSVEAPRMLPQGNKTLRIEFSEKDFSALRKIQLTWLHDDSLRIQFRRPKFPFRVQIDPGHGGVDPGAILGSHRESDLNLKASFLLAAELKKIGIESTLLREVDQSLSIARRFVAAQNDDFDLFLSIHHDVTPLTDYEDRPTCHYGRQDLFSLARALCEAVTETGRELRRPRKARQIATAGHDASAAEFLISKPVAAPTRRYLMVTQAVSTPALLLEVLNLQEPLIHETAEYQKYLNDWSRKSAAIIMRHLREAEKKAP